MDSFMSFMRFRGKSAARVVGVLAASLGGLYAAPLAHADDNQDVDNLLKEIKQDPDGLHEPPPAADPNPDAPDPGDGPESDGGPVTPVPDGSLPPAPAPPPPVAPAPPPPVAPAPPPPVAPSRRLPPSPPGRPVRRRAHGLPRRAACHRSLGAADRHRRCTRDARLPPPRHARHRPSAPPFATCLLGPRRPRAKRLTPSKRARACGQSPAPDWVRRPPTPPSRAKSTGCGA